MQLNMPIYTKTGDKGQTSLLNGKRMEKSCLEIECVGEMDELNASLGLIIASLPKKEKTTRLNLISVQKNLFVIGANLASIQSAASSAPPLTAKETEKLEKWIDFMEKNLPPLHRFLIPGGKAGSAHCFFARAVCRRAERNIVSLAKKITIPEEIIPYINRLSDLLFVLGRFLNLKNGGKETKWESKNR